MKYTKHVIVLLGVLVLGLVLMSSLGVFDSTEKKYWLGELGPSYPDEDPTLMLYNNGGVGPSPQKVDGKQIIDLSFVKMINNDLRYKIYSDQGDLLFTLSGGKTIHKHQFSVREDSSSVTIRVQDITKVLEYEEPLFFPELVIDLEDLGEYDYEGIVIVEESSVSFHVSTYEGIMESYPPIIVYSSEQLE